MMEGGMGGKMGEGMMPPEEDMYGGSETTEEPTKQGEETASKSALLPSNMFTGKPKPGDTITVKVDAVYDDEVEVSLVSKPTETKMSRPSIEEDLAAVATEVE